MVFAETHEKHHVPLRGLFILVASTEGGLTKRSISHKGRVSFPKAKNRGPLQPQVTPLISWFEQKGSQQDNFLNRSTFIPIKQNNTK